jgi:shikimate kinase
MKSKIVLIGYMGSGKSTVGKELAENIQVPFVDLDCEIESSEKTTISKIFEKKGAIYFRKIEKIILEEIIGRENRCVISLGGGTPCYFDTMAYLNNHKEVQTVYLDVIIPTLIKRLEGEIEQRPILNNINSQNGLAEFIGKHLFERRPFYNQAQLRIRIIDESPKEIAEKIIVQLS